MTRTRAIAYFLDTVVIGPGERRSLPRVDRADRIGPSRPVGGSSQTVLPKRA